MICNIKDIYKYRHYQYRARPFVIHFYNENDSNNYELYCILKSLETSYKDVPIIRFHYYNFRL